MSEYVPSNPNGYALLIQFKSNERPFNWTHSAYKIYDDIEAIEWARAMSEGMGNCYNITLVKGNDVLEYETRPDQYTDLKNPTDIPYGPQRMGRQRKLKPI